MLPPLVDQRGVHNQVALTVGSFAVVVPLARLCRPGTQHLNMTQHRLVLKAVACEQS
jgi:hypothetical protein